MVRRQPGLRAKTEASLKYDLAVVIYSAPGATSVAPGVFIWMVVHREPAQAGWIDDQSGFAAGARSPRGVVIRQGFPSLFPSIPESFAFSRR